MPFIQAAGILVAIGQIIFAVRSDIPIVLALFAFIPAAITLLSICIELAGLREFSKMFDIEVPLRTYMWVVIGFLPYHLMLGYAAGCAMWRERRGDRSWEKTRHEGHHRQQVVGGAVIIDLRESVPVVYASADEPIDEPALAASDR